MAITVKTSTVNMEAAVFANSETVPNQAQSVPVSLLFAPTTSGEFYQGITVKRTDNSANFSIKVEVGSSVVGADATIDSVLVSGVHTFTESSGVVYSDASGTTVTVSGSVPSGTDVHNVSIDFCEGCRSVSGGLTVTDAGAFSGTHTYSYPGIFHITTRVQSKNGYVDMDSFRLNLASDLSGSDLGALDTTATPESGSVTSSSGLSVLMAASGASGITVATDDESLCWRFGNLESSSKKSATTLYSEPGKFIPVANYKYAGPSGDVYVSDIIASGLNT